MKGPYPSGPGNSRKEYRDKKMSMNGKRRMAHRRMPLIDGATLESFIGIAMSRAW